MRRVSGILHIAFESWPGINLLIGQGLDDRKTEWVRWPVTQIHTGGNGCNIWVFVNLTKLLDEIAFFSHSLHALECASGNSTTHFLDSDVMQKWSVRTLRRCEFCFVLVASMLKNDQVGIQSKDTLLVYFLMLALNMWNFLEDALFEHVNCRPTCMAVNHEAR